MKKPLAQQQIENVLYCDLQNCLTELQQGAIDSKLMLYYFSEFLLAAKVDSKIIVNVLEQFGEDGEEAATGIKVNEGW